MTFQTLLLVMVFELTILKESFNSANTIFGISTLLSFPILPIPSNTTLDTFSKLLPLLLIIVVREGRSIPYHSRFLFVLRIVNELGSLSRAPSVQKPISMNCKDERSKQISCFFQPILSILMSKASRKEKLPKRIDISFGRSNHNPCYKAEFHLESQKSSHRNSSTCYSLFQS